MNGFNHRALSHDMWNEQRIPTAPVVRTRPKARPRRSGAYTSARTDWTHGSTNASPTPFKLANAAACRTPRPFRGRGTCSRWGIAHLCKAALHTRHYIGPSHEGVHPESLSQQTCSLSLRPYTPTWANDCAAPMPTLVMPQISVPIADRITRFRALPAEPTKGVIAACRGGDKLCQSGPIHGADSLQSVKD